MPFQEIFQINQNIDFRDCLKHYFFTAFCKNNLIQNFWILAKGICKLLNYALNIIYVYKYDSK